MNADANLSADGAANARANASLEAAERAQLAQEKADAQRSQLAASGLSSEGAGPPLLGARHNLTLRSTEGAVSCRCVSVLLGSSSLSQFEWKGGAPTTAPETQLVVALAPDSDCPGAPKGADGPSYWGYRIQGNDVVVLLEPLRPGPPRTIAAVIPKPFAEGQVYIEPVGSGVPYGLPLAGEGVRCALGNPGAKRVQPFGDAELGAPAPIASESSLDTY